MEIDEGLGELGYAWSLNSIAVSKIVVSFG